MSFPLLHPRDQIVAIMERIYGHDMTTTSGGNVSVRDETGDVWITPARVDKGSLRAQDIVRIRHPPRIHSTSVSMRRARIFTLSSTRTRARS